jgi:hypothetical protein
MFHTSASQARQIHLFLFSDIFVVAKQNKKDLFQAIHIETLVDVAKVTKTEPIFGSYYK